MVRIIGLSFLHLDGKLESNMIIFFVKHIMFLIVV